MSYQPFYELFPDVAAKETRVMLAIHDPDLPEDEYALVEAYCNEPGCDCRRVFFNVFSQNREEVVAVIAYGWEDKQFYADWLGDNDPKIIRELQGPALNMASPQSELAPILLQKIEYVLQDKNYVDRLKRHYRMFKEAVEKEAPKPKPVQAVSQKVGRNDPCPCGSGKKYKHCCGR
jgi:hypothetical protein